MTGKNPERVVTLSLEATPREMVALLSWAAPASQHLAVDAVAHPVDPREDIGPLLDRLAAIRFARQGPHTEPFDTHDDHEPFISTEEIEAESSEKQ